MTGFLLVHGIQNAEVHYDHHRPNQPQGDGINMSETSAPRPAKSLGEHVADQKWHPALTSALVWWWDKPETLQRELEPLFLELSAKLYDRDAAASRKRILDNLDQ